MTDHKDDFARIVRSSSGRQVLACLDQDRETGAPVVRMAVNVDGALMSVSVGFTDDDDGQTRAEAALQKFSLKQADKCERMAVEMLGGNHDDSR